MKALEALKTLGYSVRLEEPDRIRLHFEGPGKPDPEVVRPLAEEVRQHKHAVLAYLRDLEAWQEENDPGDIDERLPEVPFPLHRGVYVRDVARFLEAMRREVALGPRGPRARTGALAEDTAALRRILH